MSGGIPLPCSPEPGSPFKALKNFNKTIVHVTICRLLIQEHQKGRASLKSKQLKTLYFAVDDTAKGTSSNTTKGKSYPSIVANAYRPIELGQTTQSKAKSMVIVDEKLLQSLPTFQHFSKQSKICRGNDLRSKASSQQQTSDEIGFERPDIIRRRQSETRYAKT